MATPLRQLHIRVFVSSTFQDMQGERNELAKVVFPAPVDEDHRHESAEVRPSTDSAWRRNMQVLAEESIVTERQ
jgi:hypothetical protein